MIYPRLPSEYREIQVSVQRADANLQHRAVAAMQSIWVQRPTLSAKNAEKGGAPTISISSERLGQPPASVTISQALTERSRSNRNGRRDGERDGELFQWFGFASKTPPKRSLSGAP
jgi:hypothetical protein